MAFGRKKIQNTLWNKKKRNKHPTTVPPSVLSHLWSERFSYKNYSTAIQSQLHFLNPSEFILPMFDFDDLLKVLSGNEKNKVQVRLLQATASAIVTGYGKCDCYRLRLVPAILERKENGATNRLLLVLNEEPFRR